MWPAEALNLARQPLVKMNIIRLKQILHTNRFILDLKIV